MCGMKYIQKLNHQNYLFEGQKILYSSYNSCKVKKNSKTLLFNFVNKTEHAIKLVKPHICRGRLSETFHSPLMIFLE